MAGLMANFTSILIPGVKNRIEALYPNRIRPPPLSRVIRSAAQSGTGPGVRPSGIRSRTSDGEASWPDAGGPSFGGASAPTAFDNQWKIG